MDRGCSCSLAHIETPTARASSESDDRRWFSISLGVQTLWWCLHTSIVSSGLRDFYILLWSTSPGHTAIPSSLIPFQTWGQGQPLGYRPQTGNQDFEVHVSRSSSCYSSDENKIWSMSFYQNWLKNQRPGKALSSSGIKRFRQGDPVRPKPRHSNTTWSRTTSRTWPGHGVWATSRPPPTAPTAPGRPSFLKLQLMVLKYQYQYQYLEIGGFAGWPRQILSSIFNFEIRNKNNPTLTTSRVHLWPPSLQNAPGMKARRLDAVQRSAPHLQGLRLLQSLPSPEWHEAPQESEETCLPNPDSGQFSHLPLDSKMNKLTSSVPFRFNIIQSVQEYLGLKFGWTNFQHPICLNCNLLSSSNQVLFVKIPRSTIPKLPFWG